MPPSRSLVASALLGASLVSSVLADNPISAGFPYGQQKVRGVNLGGWLVLEPWITPSLFEETGNDQIVDEYTFGQYQDHDTAYSKLQNHWDTWITEDDFASIAKAGLNHVRLPIGYWAWDISDGEPYVQGQLPYLQKAVDWAGAHGLKVIVDLHGAPGSQNGYDNSGQKMDYPEWTSQQSNIDRTHSVLAKIADQLKNQTDNAPIIAPLNEPAGYRSSEILSNVTQYWNDAYGIIRYPFGNSTESNTLVLLHDAFQGLDYWQGFQDPPNFQGVGVDTHIYSLFSDEEVALSDQGHISAVCAHNQSISDFDKYAIVGEWTTAKTDCAKYLNGRGVGSRYDGTYPGSSKVGSCDGLTGSSDGFSDDYKDFMRKFWEAQVDTYEKGAGWIYWTWKAEDADDWSYEAGLDGGWIPEDPTDRQYDNPCGA